MTPPVRYRWLAAGLLLLGVVVATTAILGPLVTGVLRYRTSPTTLNQLIGGDAAALAVVAPWSLAVGALAWRAHPAAPVLALGPACYAVYTYTQLVVGQEYLRLPGNNERFFPLLYAGFVLGLAVAVTAIATAAGLRLGTPWARTPMYAIVGAYTMLGAAVAGMGIAMLVNHDPDASVPVAAGFTLFALAFAGLAAVLYRPLFRSPTPAAGAVFSAATSSGG